MRNEEFELDGGDPLPRPQPQLNVEVRPKSLSCRDLFRFHLDFLERRADCIAKSISEEDLRRLDEISTLLWAKWNSYHLGGRMDEDKTI